MIIEGKQNRKQTFSQPKIQILWVVCKAAEPWYDPEYASRKPMWNLLTY
jgi:hypothetical protein